MFSRDGMAIVAAARATLASVALRCAIPGRDAITHEGACDDDDDDIDGLERARARAGVDAMTVVSRARACGGGADGDARRARRVHDADAHTT
jgi:hypothetical protein